VFPIPAVSTHGIDEAIYRVASALEIPVLILALLSLAAVIYELGTFAVELRTRRRPAPPVSGRHRKRQHLRHRPRVDPITPSRFPPAQPLNPNRITNLSIELHDFHPPAPAACRQRPSAAGVLLRRNRTARPLQ